ncbi:MAG: phosphotransferase [Candidatus Paceibacterota bacterium]|jgi:fructosamine-3-kinase
MIHFKNQPKLSGAEIDKKRDDRRLALIPHVENFLSTDELFKGKKVEVEFSHEGVSSLVCFVEVGDEKFVLKIALNNTVSDGSEALFLKTWEAAGISTPHVYKEGKFADNPYILMEYIDAPTAEAKYKGDENAKQNMYFEAGKILRAMHIPESKGFGRVVDGEGEFVSFKEWIDSSEMANRVKYIEENNLLTQEQGTFDQARDILVDYIGDSNKSSYCHFDYSAGHLFATEPLTVFDPNPLFNNGYVDLGRTLVNYIAVFGTYPKQLVGGYIEGGALDEKVLHAAIILNIVYKLPYQHQKGKSQVIQNYQDYLAQYQHSQRP